jgi:hypothetical protein
VKVPIRKNSMESISISVAWLIEDNDSFSFCGYDSRLSDRALEDVGDLSL